MPPGQEFTYTVRAQGRLVDEEQFGDIVVRASPDGSMIRVRDVARVELGAQVYNVRGRFNGKSAAIVALYQSPGSNALDARNAALALMDELKQRFPSDLEYTRLARHHARRLRGHPRDPARRSPRRSLLVVLVVFLFLQGYARHPDPAAAPCRSR